MINEKYPLPILIFSGFHQVIFCFGREQFQNCFFPSLTQDPDAGENATVTYHFVASDGMNDLRSFSLDSKTGVITTKRPLDYEVRRAYTLTVLARDQGRGRERKESEARLVRVEVRDINDNQPIFVDHQQVCARNLSVPSSH